MFTFFFVFLAQLAGFSTFKVVLESNGCEINDDDTLAYSQLDMSTKSLMFLDDLEYFTPGPVVGTSREMMTEGSAEQQPAQQAIYVVEQHVTTESIESYFETFLINWEILKYAEPATFKKISEATDFKTLFGVKSNNPLQAVAKFLVTQMVEFANGKHIPLKIFQKVAVAAGIRFPALSSSAGESIENDASVANLHYQAKNTAILLQKMLYRYNNSNRAPYKSLRSVEVAPKQRKLMSVFEKSCPEWNPPSQSNSQSVPELTQIKEYLKAVPAMTEIVLQEEEKKIIQYMHNSFHDQRRIINTGGLEKLIEEYPSFFESVHVKSHFAKLTEHELQFCNNTIVTKALDFFIKQKKITARPAEKFALKEVIKAVAKHFKEDFKSICLELLVSFNSLK